MEKFLLRWFENGLIDKNQYDSLLENYIEEKNKSKKLKIQITLYIIGALLLGIGVIVFIQANDWLIDFFARHNILKIALCFILASCSLYWGSELSGENSKFPKLGISLIFLSTLLIGGLYALIGQVYNIEANTFWLFLIWFLSVYPLAFIFKNQAINILSIVLLIISACLCLNGFTNAENVKILIPILIGSFLYCMGNIPIVQKNFSDFTISYKITGLFSVFISLFILTFEGSSSYRIDNFGFIAFFIITLLLNMVNYVSSKEKTPLLKVETFYISFIMLWSITLAEVNHINNYFVGFVANILIIIMICQCYKFGYLFENAKFSNLATKLLNIYLIINYFRIGGKYLDFAIISIIAGIILIVLGIHNEKNKKIKKGQNK